MKPGRWLFTKKRLLFSGLALLLVVVVAGAGFLFIPRPITRWSFRAEGPYLSSFFSPIVSNGLVYTVFNLGISNHLLVLDAHSGQIRWSSTPDGFIPDAPIVANGLVYILVNDLVESQSTLYALNAASGREQWSYQHAQFSSPAIGNGMVYVHSIDGNLFALDALSGRQLWSVQVGRGFFDAPMVADHLVYVDAGNQAGASVVFALDAASGAKKWSAVEATPLITQLSIANGLVYVAAGGAGAQVWALDAFSGRTEWSAQLAGSDVFANIGFAASSFQVVNGIAYVDYAQVDLSGTLHPSTLYALDARTGQRVWTSQTVSQEPTIANGKVYVYSGDDYFGGKLSALDARSGRPLWSYAALLDSVADSIEPEPAVENGKVYVWTYSDNQDTLHALDAGSGSEQWSYQIGGSFLVPPTVAQGIVYACIRRNDGTGVHVEAFQPPGGAPGFAW